MSEHTFLVGITVTVTDEAHDTDQAARAAAERIMVDFLGVPSQRQGTRYTNMVESWWVCEDDHRHDGSDQDSAVFVKMGKQAEAAQALLDAGLAHHWSNDIDRLSQPVTAAADVAPPAEPLAWTLWAYEGDDSDEVIRFSVDDSGVFYNLLCRFHGGDEVEYETWRVDADGHHPLDMSADRALYGRLGFEFEQDDEPSKVAFQHVRNAVADAKRAAGWHEAEQRLVTDTLDTLTIRSQDRKEQS